MFRDANALTVAPEPVSCKTSPTDALSESEVKAVRHIVRTALAELYWPEYYQEIGLQIIAWCDGEIKRMEGGHG